MNLGVSFRSSCSGKMAKMFVLQCNVATYVWYGGEHDKNFIANSLLNSTVKNLENRSTSATVMHECKVASF